MIKLSPIAIEFEYQKPIKAEKHRNMAKKCFLGPQKAAKLFKYSLNPCSMRATRYAVRSATKLKLKDWRYRSG